MTKAKKTELAELLSVYIRSKVREGQFVSDTYEDDRQLQSLLCLLIDLRIITEDKVKKFLN